MKNTENARKLKRIAEEKGKKAIDTAWKSKPLHGQYPLWSQKADVDLHDTHQWLRSTGLKAETEGFTVVAQDQSLFTKNFQANIFHNGADPRCRFCNTSIETIGHLISGCTILAPNEDTNRHNRVGQYMHWKICNHYNTETHNKQYEHKPLPVVDNSQVTILWDFPIRTDRTIQANRPDIVIKHKKNKTCQLIVWVCHQIAIFLLMSLKNLVNIKIWKLKLLRCGKMKTKTIPVIAEALGMIKKGKGNTKKC